VIIPDLIMIWPRHVDYPYARWSLERFKPYFGKILIGLTDMGKLEDYTQFFVNNVDAEFKNIPMGQGDWRNNAVNTMLEYSTADHVVFLEQDFLIRDARLPEVIFNTNLDYNTVTYDEHGRTHPAFALVPRELIEKTSKDFGANPEAGYDHFGKFFRELSRFANACDITDLGLKEHDDFYHMAGLTQNYHARPYFKPSEFLTYNHYSLQLPVKQSEFAMVMEKVDKEPFVEDEQMRKFFPK
jgi:hypothetical protein